jgi:Plasmid pRiA4b ORF-3-like protein
MEHDSQPEAYCIHVRIREIHPMLWRRFLVRADSTLADLHGVLQIGFDWTDFQIHRFRIRKKDYAVPRLGGLGCHDARKIKLADLHFRVTERFLYEYERIEKRLEVQTSRSYPVCVGGQWAGATGGALPPPGPPLTVGLDGGFIHAKDQKSRGEGWFEVIAGKSMSEEGAAKCFAYVQTYDTNPKRRLFELMKSQGLQANQQVTFLSDGADDVRELPLYLSLYTWLSLVHQARGNARHTKPESRRVERGNEPRGHPLSAGWRWYHSQATRGRGAGTFSNTLWNGIPFER